MLLKWDDGAEWLRDDLQGGMRDAGYRWGCLGGGLMLGFFVLLAKKRPVLGAFLTKQEI